jgi:hypothetical protein
MGVQWGLHNTHNVSPPSSCRPFVGGMQAWVDRAVSPGAPLELFYTDPTVRDYYRKWVREVVTRINTISGLPYRDDPTVLAWWVGRVGVGVVAIKCCRCMKTNACHCKHAFGCLCTGRPPPTHTLTHPPTHTHFPLPLTRAYIVGSWPMSPTPPTCTRVSVDWHPARCYVAGWLRCQPTYMA